MSITGQFCFYEDRLLSYLVVNSMILPLKITNHVTAHTHSHLIKRIRKFVPDVLAPGWLEEKRQLLHDCTCVPGYNN